MSRWIITLVILSLSLPAVASAALLTLDYSGTFSDDSTLNGVAFGAVTPFTYSAVFDSLTDSEPDNGVGVFDAVVTINIPGIGIFMNGPAANVNVLLGDPDNGIFPFFVGIGDGITFDLFGGVFTMATPVFDADVPTPSMLTGLGLTFDALPFTIPLTGGGNLVVVGVISGNSATISQVPIPNAFLLFGTGLVGLIGWRRWSRDNN